MVIPEQKPTASSTAVRVRPETVQKAINALLKWGKSQSQNQKPQLLEQDDDFIYLVLTLKKIPQKGRTNAHKIPLPNSIFRADTPSELCLIIDDRARPNKLTSEAAKKKIIDEDIPISKVIKISKLKTDYKAFEAKRKLADSYDMFFVDRRIVHLLPKTLGKHFFKKKKIPLPVDLTHKNWKEQIERARSSALLYLKTGTCSVVRIATAGMEVDEIVENVVAGVNGVAEVVPKKWAGVRSFHLKFSDSLALPIYHTLPDVKLKIEGLSKVKKVEEETDEKLSEEKAMDLVMGSADSKTKKKKTKGRIHEVRYMDDNNEFGSEDDDAEIDEEVVLASPDLTKKKRKKGDSSEKTSEKKKQKKKGGIEKSVDVTKKLKLKVRRNSTSSRWFML